MILFRSIEQGLKYFASCTRVKAQKHWGVHINSASGHCSFSTAASALLDGRSLVVATHLLLNTQAVA